MSRLKQKALRVGLYAFGTLALLVFVGVYYRSFMEVTTVTSRDYGGSYLEAQVNRFKFAIPPTPEPIRQAPVPFSTEPGRPAPAHDVYVTGDSFFWIRMGYLDFTTQLAERLGQPVYYLGHYLRNPLRLTEEANLDADTPKVVVLGMMEWLLVGQLSDGYNPNPQVDRSAEAPWVAWAKQVRRELFLEEEQKYAYFLRNNYVSFGLTALVRSFLFEQFGLIDDYTPVYSKEPPVLFIEPTVAPDALSSSFYHRSDSLIETIAGHAAVLRDTLAARYNAHMVFVPVPNKVTVYGELVEGQPDTTFFPRLYEALGKRDIPTVRLFEAFNRHDGWLYYRSDHHWNQQGMSIALDSVATMIPRLGAP